MHRLILAALASLSTVSVMSVALAHGGSHPTRIMTMPACKSGWKLDVAQPFSPGQFRYVPLQYVATVPSHPPRHTTITLISQDGTVTTTVKRGRTVRYDCFDIPVGDTI